MKEPCTIQWSHFYRISGYQSPILSNYWLLLPSEGTDVDCQNTSLSTEIQISNYLAEMEIISVVDHPFNAFLQHQNKLIYLQQVLSRAFIGCSEEFITQCYVPSSQSVNTHKKNHTTQVYIKTFFAFPCEAPDLMWRACLPVKITIWYMLHCPVICI